MWMSIFCPRYLARDTNLESKRKADSVNNYHILALVLRNFHIGKGSAPSEAAANIGPND